MSEGGKEAVHLDEDVVPRDGAACKVARELSQDEAHDRMLSTARGTYTVAGLLTPCRRIRRG